MSHQFALTVDADGLWLSCVCRYDKTDEMRPCWPWDIECDEPEKLPAPQNECTFEDWIENEGNECLGGEVEIPLELVNHEWDDGALRVWLKPATSP